MKELWTTEKAHAVRRVFNAVQELNALVRQAADEGLEVKIGVVPIWDSKSESCLIVCNVNQPITDLDIP